MTMRAAQIVGCGITHSPTKGNNGRAARVRLIRRVGITVGWALVLALVFALYQLDSSPGVETKSTGNKKRHNLQLPELDGYRKTEEAGDASEEHPDSQLGNRGEELDEYLNDENDRLRRRQQRRQKQWRRKQRFGRQNFAMKGNHPREDRRVEERPQDKEGKPLIPPERQRRIMRTLLKQWALEEFDDDDEVEAERKEKERLENEEIVLSADVQLVDLFVPPSAFEEEGTYEGVKAVFCKVDWAKHKADPSVLPMWHDLMFASPDCENNQFGVDLKTIVTRARSYDAKPGSKTKSLTTSGFIFNESRCGSTLAANALVHADPEGHRVYSEPVPPLEAAKSCEDEDDCDIDVVVEMLRDVVYMMGRTNDPKEKRQYFKIQATATLWLPVFRRAFPSIPWVFIFREPVQVLMSHFKVKEKEEANCIKQFRPPHPVYDEILDGIPDLTVDVAEMDDEMSDLTVEQRCALYLAGLCEVAQREQIASSKSGVMINYESLPNILVDSIFPGHFDLPLSSEAKERVLDGSSQYSKNRVNQKGKQRYANGFVPDSEKKEERAGPEVRAAADLLLRSRFEYLQGEASEYLSSVDTLLNRDSVEFAQLI